ncbi:unnamed protein product, partial [Closterium sp. NIES-54]
TDSTKGVRLRVRKGRERGRRRRRQRDTQRSSGRTQCHLVCAWDRRRTRTTSATTSASRASRRRRARRRRLTLSKTSNRTSVFLLATQRSSQGYTFSLGSGSVSWRSTRSSSVLSSSCEAEIYATAMAAQELRWLTYLLTDLGERPHSPPVLYVDNKATIALCQEHRLEHRTKHIALPYFLARELQQRGQLRLRFVATEANTADVFTKALPPPEAVVELVAELHRRVAPVVVSASSSSAVVRPPPLSSFVSGTLGVSEVECGGPHSTQRCFGRLTDAWRHQFPDATEIPRWGDLSRAGVAVFDLDYDAILVAMYALSTSDEGDCYLCVPPDPGIEAAALGAGETAALGASAYAAPGAGESAPSGTASAQVFHTFTLDSGASRSFFQDRTTLTPLSRPVAVSLADPSGGPVLASFSTVLPCPAAPSGSLSGLYLPSFSTNLVAASSQVLAAASGSGPESAPCSCRLLSHQNLLWHHRLGHPSLPRLRGMASRVLVSGLPRSLPPLPLGPALTCVPCVEGRQRAAPHSSEFPPTEAPLQTLHMDVWGPARVRGQGHERYFLLVVDDYSRYTTVFPLRGKGEVTEVLIDWIRAARLRLRESFGSDFLVLRLHSDRGGEFSSARLGAFCRVTLPASPQQNGIAERRIGMVMEVARKSMIHAAAPHFLWPFAVQYAAQQLNLQPRVSLPETSPTLLWTGKVGDASVFRVWGSRAFVRDLSADKLSPRAVPCVFLGFPPDTPGWQFYHPTSRRVLSSQDVTFDESVPYYRLFPYRSASLPPPPLFLAPGAATGAEPAGAGSGGAGSGGDETEGAEPAGAGAGGAEPGGAEFGGAETWGAEPRGTATRGPEPGGAEPGVTAPGGAEPGGAGSARVASRGASSRREVLSPQELREWNARRWGRAAGAGGTTATTGSGGTCPGGAGAAGPGGTAEAVGVGPTGCSAGASGGTGAAGSAGPRAAGAAGVGAAGGVGAGVSADVGTSEGAGAGGATGAGAPAGSPSAVPAGSGGAPQPRPYFVLLLEQPVSPLPAPSPYTSPTGGLAERCAPASRPASPSRPARTSRQRPPAVPGTHQMALRPSTAPLRFPLPSPPASSLPAFPDLESDSLRAASPTVARFLATVVTDPSLASTAASALVAELVDFAASCRLDYAAGLVAETASVCPSSVGGECALSTDVLEDRQEEFQCFAAALPHLVAIDFDVWVDDLLLFLQCDRADGLSLFDLTSGASPAPAATEDATVRSQWATRDAAARLAVRRHLPPSERAHFGSYKSAQTLYDAVIARYSTPATAALSRLMLPYLFPDLASFATVVDLITHLRTNPDALDIPTPRSYAEAMAGPYSSQWQSAMDAEMASWKSTGTYIDAVPPPGANIVSGMWIFRVKRPPGSPPVFKARYVARGFMACRTSAVADIVVVDVVAADVNCQQLETLLGVMGS